MAPRRNARLSRKIRAGGSHACAGKRHPPRSRSFRFPKVAGRTSRFIRPLFFLSSYLCFVYPSVIFVRIARLHSFFSFLLGSALRRYVWVSTSLGKGSPLKPNQFDAINLGSQETKDAFEKKTEEKRARRNLLLDWFGKGGAFYPLAPSDAYATR